jgi:hypothetical protein
MVVVVVLIVVVIASTMIVPAPEKAPGAKRTDRHQYHEQFQH